MHSFDPLTIPLTGQQLVEASAGTGKTYSIAQLFLRFILEGELDVDNILVVTFTKSATEELRQRIRSRLSEAYDVLKAAGHGKIVTKDDEILGRLLSQLNDRDKAVQRLAWAIARMDESAIYTIHSFCQRMLQDHAFESGSPFAIEFIESEQDLRLEIVQDFWRKEFYTAPEEKTAWATATFTDPAKLLQELSPILAQTEINCIPEVQRGALDGLRKSCAASFQGVVQGWQEMSDEVKEILANDKGLTRNAKSYRPDRVQIILTGMEKLTAMDSFPWLLPEGTELLAASVMAENVKKNKPVPEHSFFNLFDIFYESVTELTRLARIHVLVAALDYLSVERQQRKKVQAQMYFDDLLTGLDKALLGPGGENLIQHIRQRYKVALVDEFQDTDPLQYRIFHRLFGQGPNPGLFMIGDPKQSIYSFRGADVFAYIKAKKDTLAQSAAFTMGTNYRSTPAMVRAVNRLFDRENPFVVGEDISFSPVEAGRKATEEPLMVKGDSIKPLQAMLLPVDSLTDGKKNYLTKGLAEEAATSWTACQIANLLHLGNTGEAKIGNRPLSGRDVAVLVRTHREAAMIQQALSVYRIASVYYSQDSVFSAEEARDIYLVLLALLDLSDTSRVTTALVSPLFDMDAHELEQLLTSGVKWDETVARLEEYHVVWHKQGIAAMLQKLIGDQQVVQRMIQLPGGERKLTNYLHLAELLQEASEQQLGTDGLVQWFSQQQDSEITGANQQLRLESDENLVRIVTIHKAKGLEYPVVFLPYSWSSRQVKTGDSLFFHQQANMEHVVDIGSGNPDHYQRARREKLAEDLRLLYVAVTRARYGCYFTWGRISAIEQSAMAWLLHRDDDASQPNFVDLSEERIAQDLAALNRDGAVVDFPEYPPDFRLESEVSGKSKGPQLTAKTFHGTIDTGWTISSYSQLARAAVHLNRAEEAEYAQPEMLPKRSGPNVYTFPRGADAGTCLHGIFEELDFSAYTKSELQQLAHEHLRKNGLDLHWSPLACTWIEDVLKTSLNSGGMRVRLQELQQNDRLVELGFYFSMDRLDPSALNGVLRDFGYSPIDIKTEELTGLMRGYIDLVFRHQGKYFLADYKSNYLGASPADYQADRLEAAMAEHRYDLQYLIYTVALHRYLATRIQEYDYQRHFGGVYYLFLRGMHPDHPEGNGVFATVPDPELIEGLDKCFGWTEKL